MTSRIGYGTLIRAASVAKAATATRSPTSISSWGNLHPYTKRSVMSCVTSA